MPDQVPLPEMQVIPHEVMVAVLNRCDETREFMVQIWLQNPQLAKQGGAKVAALLSPLPIFVPGAT